jgi:hypothetical protein
MSIKTLDKPQPVTIQEDTIMGYATVNISTIYGYLFADSESPKR